MAERPDYRSFVDSFDPSVITDSFSGDLDTGINACVECVDRHLGSERLALRWAGAAGDRGTLSTCRTSWTAFRESITV